VAAFLLEASDVELWVTEDEVNGFLEDLRNRGVRVQEIERGSDRVLRIEGGQAVELVFRRRDGELRLVTRRVQFSQKSAAEAFRDFVVRHRGHATIKYYSKEVLVVQHVQYGEVVRITEISGNQRKVLLDKKGWDSAEKVIEALTRTDVEERIPALRAELDAALDELGEALRRSDAEAAERAKARLRVLRREMLLYEL